ncbi:hypothetical protein N0V93_006982 [Gnomoniopsis smithogilvyi]|uniref:Aflatoxin regulatory protein domain-containing protein n=1 Tax=Gnomoniopsis smithogilvyi TaxID=1191159 RepID=A0A9W9CW80_9PEZI|nr:hypothetical protein N0V93_006982 [Gnomoniopsis smithogilvyi]
MACSRAKPTCARCARRGEVCVYGPMKRAGRKKQQSQRQQPARDETQSRQRSSSVIVSLPSPSPDETVGNPSNATSISHPPLSLDLFIQDSSDTDPAVDHTNRVARPLPVEGYDATTAKPQALEMACNNRPGTQNNEPTDKTCFSGAEDGNNVVNASAGANFDPFTPLDIDFGALEDADWMLTSPNFSQAGSNTPIPTYLSTLPIGSSYILESTRTTPHALTSNSCLSLALRVLSALTPPLDVCAGKLSSEGKHRQDSLSSETGLVASSSASNDFDEVMQRNLASIDAISPILKCSCAVNSNVILILSHVVFQILTWYTAAAGVPGAASWLGQRTQVPQVPPPVASSMPGYDLAEEETEDRVRCQTVLSKMHSVRNVVEGLSRILLHDRKEASHNHFQFRNTQSLLSLGTNPPSALAISLEDELRRCLRDASRAIVAKLAEV